VAKTLVIRADAGPEIGAGHLTRCLALAQAWRATGGLVVFVVAESMSVLGAEIARLADVAEISAPAGGAQDAAETLVIADRHAATWIVLDGHRFHSDYESRVSSAASRILVIDDTACQATFHADVLLNHNVSATPQTYAESAPGSRLLLGPDYMLLRESFGRHLGVKRDIPRVASKVLVALGGGDVSCELAIVLAALAEADVAGIDVLVAAGYSRSAKETVTAALRSAPLHVRLARPDDDMAAAMAWADIAVSGGGTTSLELASMGVPCVSLVVDENQRANVAGLEHAGVALDAGPVESPSASRLARMFASLAADAERRATMSRLGRALVDGHGAERVAAVLLQMEARRAGLARTSAVGGSAPPSQTTSDGKVALS
jgi:UDP-2,4-diacetamido-2,4,6-trideoxy-beta-L-altropyranose hydrolase